jgi:hypothetical protein
MEDLQTDISLSFPSFLWWDDATTSLAANGQLFPSSPPLPSPSRFFPTDIPGDTPIDPFSPLRPRPTTGPSPNRPTIPIRPTRPSIPTMPQSTRQTLVQQPVVQPSDDYRDVRSRYYRFPQECRSKLQSWFYDHIEHPFPSRDFIQQIKDTWHVTDLQIRTFFTNQRTRYGVDHPEMKARWQMWALVRQRVIAMQSE